jgi:hypothetical protein
MAKIRIPTTTIDSTYSDGDILYGYDVNRIIDVFREAANANKLDINKLLTGTDYLYIAEDLTGLDELADESLPTDGQKGFIFNGSQDSLQIYTYSVDSGEWVLLSGTSLLNPYVDSVNIGGRQLNWNEVDGTVDISLNDDVTLQVGQEQLFYGKAYQQNILNGQPVMFAGIEGNHFRIQVATTEVINANPEYFIGIATQDIDSGEFGYVTEFGFTRSVNVPADTYNIGDILWFDSQGTGSDGWTTTKPDRGYAQIRMAAVVKQNQNVNQTYTGEIFVRPSILEASGSITTFQQSTEPTVFLEGDLWFDTTPLAYALITLTGGLFTTTSFDTILDGASFDKEEETYTYTTDGGSF